MQKSPLQIARQSYQPKMPVALQGNVKLVEGAKTESVADQADIKDLFPNTYGLPVITMEPTSGTPSCSEPFNVGVILSGGQAPGGHNVICGLYDALKALNPENVLIGFKGGPSGLLDNDFIVFEDDYINQYRNTGGFDIIGSGRTKLETEEQFAIVAENCKKHGINALVIIGGLKSDEGTIDLPIARHATDRKKMAINHYNGRRAVTHWTVLERFSGFSYVELRLETGRTHQIRVHMTSIGHPLVGDEVYGPAKCPFKLQGQCLHAMILGFIHPRTGEYMEFSADLPEYFENLLRKL